MRNCQPPAVPAPLAPYERLVQSPLANIIGDASIINIPLSPEVTYLQGAATAAPGGTYALTLPPGNTQQLFKRIYIPGALVVGTATWVITGTFAGGFTKLTFNALATSAVLEWDGSSYQLIGGNAILSP
jgi:hypothetical protein